MPNTTFCVAPEDPSSSSQASTAHALATKTSPWWSFLIACINTKMKLYFKGRRKIEPELEIKSSGLKQTKVSHLKKI